MDVMQFLSLSLSCIKFGQNNNNCDVSVVSRIVSVSSFVDRMNETNAPGGGVTLIQNLVERQHKWRYGQVSRIQDELSFDAITSCCFVSLQPFQSSLDFFMCDVRI